MRRRLHSAALWSLLALIAASSFVVAGTTPRLLPPVDLGAVAPGSTPHWKLIRSEPLQTENPIASARRTIYESPLGERLALTIAFSPDQRRAYELHLPDICHRVRGDSIRQYVSPSIRLSPERSLTAYHFSWQRRDHAAAASTWYWIVLDGTAVDSLLSLRWVQLLGTVTGSRQSGLLARVDLFHSTDTPTTTSDRVEGFLSRWYEGLRPEDRELIFGSGRT